MATDTTAAPAAPPAEPSEEPSKYVTPGLTFRSVTDRICALVLAERTSPGWYAVFGLGATLLLVFTVAVVYLLVKGVGIWGINIPVAWGFAITNFVWWIGIGHA